MFWFGDTSKVDCFKENQLKKSTIFNRCRIKVSVRVGVGVKVAVPAPG